MEGRNLSGGVDSLAVILNSIDQGSEFLDGRSHLTALCIVAVCIDC